MTDGRTDRRTDGRTDGGDCNIPNAFLKKRGDNKDHYTTLTNFSTKYLMMCKVYTDVGGIK